MVQQISHASGAATVNPNCLGNDLTDKHASKLLANAGAGAWTAPLRVQVRVAGNQTFYRMFQQGFQAPSNTVVGQQGLFNIAARKELKKTDLEWMVANWPGKIKELDKCVRQAHSDLEITDGQLSSASKMLKQLQAVIDGPVKQMLAAFNTKPEVTKVILDAPFSSVGASGVC